jgi:hypothetical protein
MNPNLMEKILQSFEKPDMDFMIPGYTIDAARVVWLIKNGLTVEELLLLKQGIEDICLSHHLGVSPIEP